VQGTQLRDDEEQKEPAEPARVQEVLPSLPVPYTAQREQVAISDLEFWILD
jgi:hypothetical protein